MHQYPILSLEHLSRDPRITGLIRIPEVPPTQIKKEQDETETQEEGELGPFLMIDIK
jgi:hypothetical protein